MANKDPSKDEVEQLLNMKLDADLDDLDIEDTESSKDSDAGDVTPMSSKELANLPSGEEGFQKILKSPSVQKVDKDLEKGFEDAPNGKPLRELVSQIEPDKRTEDYKADVKNSFENSVKSVEQLYRRVLSGEKIHYSEIMRIVDSFMKIFLTDQCILLNFSNYDNKSNDYLYHHVLKVSLLSMNLANTLGYSKEQVNHVGVAGLLADIGMVMIQDSIRLKPSSISKNELFDIQKHPMVGIHILEKIKGIPGPVAYVAYQHHERNSGMGYPKGRGARLIHNYAKIVSIADVYLALNSHRVYRKGLKAYDAIVKVLHMAKGNQLDREMVKKFVALISLFPVGSLVKITGDKTAKVIQSNPHAVDRPWVSIIDQSSSEKALVDLSQDTGIKIIEPLPKSVLENSKLMEGF